MKEPGRADSPLLTLRGVSIGYGRAPVLRHVDWTIEPGERWFVLGPNAAGKSTLLRALLGEITPQAGSITRSRCLEGRRRIGLVPQRARIAASLPTTVSEIVSLGSVGLGLARQERRERLAWALERSGLAALADQDPRALSGGQCQRVLVARALVRRPRLLLLDEPTTGLDEDGSAALFATLEELGRDERPAVVLVTHRRDQALEFGERFVLCEGGLARVGGGALLGVGDEGIHRIRKGAERSRSTGDPET